MRGNSYLLISQHRHITGIFSVKLYTFLYYNISYQRFYSSYVHLASEPAIALAPNNGNVCDPLFSSHFVLCREVVIYRRLRITIIRTIGKSPFGTLNCLEVISIVPLYN